MQQLTEDLQDTLVDWLGEQGLDANEISVYRFRVNEGRISGFKFLFSDEGTLVMRKHQPVLVPFNIEQQTALPKELHA